ncbi:MAG: FAD:protein FMN transferase [Candidatus Coproplasma sp.]
MNKQRIMLCAVSLSAVALCGVLSSCKSGETPKSDSYFMPIASYSQYKSSGSAMAEGYGYVMGTDAVLRIADENNFDTEEKYNAFSNLWEEVKGVLLSAENSVSATIETSCIYKFNQAKAGSTVEIDETAYEIISLAKSVYEDTDGYFNPAVYQSVRLFGFGTADYKQPENMPSYESVQAFKTLADSFADLTLSVEQDKYYATKPTTTVSVDGAVHSLKLDLGGIGKGWCADKIDELIDASGFTYGYLSLGSSTMAIKRHNSSDGNNYTLSVRDPRANGSYAKFAVKDSRLSTSGDYEQFYEVDGVRYCHIIDPKTGSPIQTGVASATVVGDSAAQDDALTTALSAMGKVKAVEYINEKLSDRFVLMLVFEEGQGKIITNRPDKVTVTNGEYSLGNTVVDGKIVLD